MPTFRMRTATGEPGRTTEAWQFTGPPADPPGVERESGGRIGRAFVIDALGRRVYPEPGDWILPDPDGGHHLVSDPRTFAVAWEPVTAVAPKSSSPTGSRVGGPTVVAGTANGWDLRNDHVASGTPAKHANVPQDAPDAHGDNQT